MSQGPEDPVGMKRLQTGLIPPPASAAVWRMRHTSAGRRPASSSAWFTGTAPVRCPSARPTSAGPPLVTAPPTPNTPTADGRPEPHAGLVVEAVDDRSPQGFNSPGIRESFLPVTLEFGSGKDARPGPPIDRFDSEGRGVRGVSATSSCALGCSSPLGRSGS
jgi:hypothetical protein